MLLGRRLIKDNVGSFDIRQHFQQIALKLRESCAGQRDFFVRTCPDDTDDLRYKPALYSLAQSAIFHLLLKTTGGFGIRSTVICKIVRLL